MGIQRCWVLLSCLLFYSHVRYYRENVSAGIVVDACVFFFRSSSRWTNHGNCCSGRWNNAPLVRNIHSAKFHKQSLHCRYWTIKCFSAEEMFLRTQVWMSDIDIVKALSLGNEFRSLPVTSLPAKTSYIQFFETQSHSKINSTKLTDSSAALFPAGRNVEWTARRKSRAMGILEPHDRFIAAKVNIACNKLTCAVPLRNFIGFSFLLFYQLDILYSPTLTLNPFTPKNNRLGISPAASPGI